MTPKRKHLWSIPDSHKYVVCLAGFAGAAILAPLVGWGIAWVAAGYIVALTLLLMMLLRKGDPREVATDEREKALLLKARYWASQIFMAAIGFVGMAIFFYCMSRNKDSLTISLQMLPVILLVGICGYAAISAILYLILRRRGVSRGEK